MGFDAGTVLLCYERSLKGGKLSIRPGSAIETIVSGYPLPAPEGARLWDRWKEPPRFVQNPGTRRDSRTTVLPGRSNTAVAATLERHGGSQHAPVINDQG